VNFAGLILLYAYYVVERTRLERMRQRALALRLTRGRRG